MGGRIYSLEMVYPQKRFEFPDLTPERMKLDRSYVNRLLGLNLKEFEIKKLLERMGYDYQNGVVLVPKYRSDVLHQIDLVEDIAIAYGYENFKPVMSTISSTGEEDPFEAFKNKAAYVMTGLGYLETSSYHLTNADDMNGKMSTDVDCIELLNASTIDYNMLRAWITPNLMKVLGENTRHDYPQRIFEIGSVFKRNPKTETGIEEFTRMAAASCHNDADYTEMRQVLDAFIRSLGLKCRATKTEHGSFIPGRVARITVNGKKVAYVGEIHPEVLGNWGIAQPVSCFELNLTELFGLIR